MEVKCFRLSEFIKLKMKVGLKVKDGFKVKDALLSTDKWSEYQERLIRNHQ